MDADRSGSQNVTTDEIGLPAYTADLPPTARLAYRFLLDADRPVTIAELATWCRCGDRTARKAVSDLAEADLAEPVADPTNPGSRRWEATPPE